MSDHSCLGFCDGVLRVESRYQAFSEYPLPRRILKSGVLAPALGSGGSCKEFRIIQGKISVDGIWTLYLEVGTRDAMDDLCWNAASDKEASLILITVTVSGLTPQESD